MGSDESKHKEEERRKSRDSLGSWDRRTGIERRKSDDSNFKGPERRSGLDRRSGFDRRTGEGDKKIDQK